MKIMTKRRAKEGKGYEQHKSRDSIGFRVLYLGA